MSSQQKKASAEAAASAKKIALPLKTPTRAEMDKLIEKSASGHIEEPLELFLALLRYAHATRASDIHFEPDREQAVVRLRIDGILHDEFILPLSIHNRLISLIKILTHMRTDEHRAPQDGRYEFQAEKGNVDVRTSIMPTSDGEKAVMRLLSSESHSLSLEQLGFGEKDLDRVKRAVKKPWGMILATGPTGSGKTTTIYAILEMLNNRGVNISTIEDPVEFYIPGVNQSQVDQAAKVTFANGLRALLRQDPDIIMVGEVRDQETAKIAVNAALTGHKMLSTLHTNNAATTIPRLLDMGVEPFLVASTLILAIAQRLLRRICPECCITKKVTYEEAKNIVDVQALEELFKKGKTIEVVEAKGCRACNESGYRGRIGLYEVIAMTEELQKLIIRRSSADDIERQAISEGMTPMMKDGADKVLQKETTLEEFVRVMYE